MKKQFDNISEGQLTFYTACQSEQSIFSNHLNPNQGVYYSYGFEEKQFQNTIEKPIFSIENKQLFNNQLKENEEIEKIAISKYIIVMISSQKRIFRWKMGKHSPKQPTIYPLQKIHQDLLLPVKIIGKTAKFLQKGILKTIEKAIGKKSVQQFSNTITVEKIFMDSKGNHCFFSSIDGYNFYLNKNSEKVRFLPNLRGFEIQAISFNQEAQESSTQNLINIKEILIGGDNGYIIQYKLDFQKKQKKQGNLIDKTKILIQNAAENVQLVGKEILGIKKKLVEIKETITKTMLYLPQTEIQNIQINDLQVIYYPSSNNVKIILVFISTNSSIFYFSGQDNFDNIAKQFNLNNKIINEIPFQQSRGQSLMQIFYKKENPYVANSTAIPESLIWTNGQNLILFQLPQQGAILQLNLSILNRPIMLRHAKMIDQLDTFAYVVTEPPIDVGLSEFHYFLLHKQSLTILSRITQKVVQFFDFTQKKEEFGIMKSFYYDKNIQVLYFYSEKSIWFLRIFNEPKDTIYLYLNQGQIKQADEVSRRFNSSSQDYAFIQFIYLFYSYKIDKHSICRLFIQESAITYKFSKLNFEQIVLKFLFLKKEQQAIETFLFIQNFKVYLFEILKEFHPDNTSQKQTILAILLQLKLFNFLDLQRQYETMTMEIIHKKDQNEISQLSKQIQYLKQKDNQKLNELDQFIIDYKEVMSFQVSSQIFNSYGQDKDYQFFVNETVIFYFQLLLIMKQKQNYEELIYFNIWNENFFQTIQTIIKCMTEQQQLNCLNKYLHIFFRFIPEQTIILLKKYQIKLNLQKLLNSSLESPKQAKIKCIIPYFKYLLDSQIYKLQEELHQISNLMLVMIAELGQQFHHLIYDFLNEQYKIDSQDGLFINLYQAMITFKRFNIIKAQIICMGLMENYTEGVSMALLNKEVCIAKQIANRCKNQITKRKLWMKIINFMIENQFDNEEILKLTQETDCLNFDDILPFFDGNLEIKHLKQPICNSLNQQSQMLDDMKFTLMQNVQNAEQIQKELSLVNTKFIIIGCDQKCNICFKNIYDDDFYFFPCQHGFHQQCIIRRLSENAQNNLKLEIILEIQEKLNGLLIKKKNLSKQYQEKVQESKQQNFFNLFKQNKKLLQENFQLNEEEENQLKNLQQNYSFLLASECLNCGMNIINSIKIPLDLDSNEKWLL